LEGFRCVCFEFGAVSDVSDSGLASVDPGGYLSVGEAFVYEGLDLLDLLGCVSSSQTCLIYLDSDILICLIFVSNPQLSVI